MFIKYCSWFLVSGLAFLAGCSAEDSQTDESAAPPAEQSSTASVGVSPIGKWTIVEANLYGQAVQDSVGETVVINDDGTAEWPRYGQTETIEFALQNANADGTIPITVATNEDQPPMGGAGPRNGLLRTLESGEVEIIETTSAGEPVPAGFGEEVQKNAQYYRLKAAQ